MRDPDVVTANLCDSHAAGAAVDASASRAGSSKPGGADRDDANAPHARSLAVTRGPVRGPCPGRVRRTLRRATGTSPWVGAMWRDVAMIAGIDRMWRGPRAWRYSIGEISRARPLGSVRGFGERSTDVTRFPTCPVAWRSFGASTGSAAARPFQCRVHRAVRARPINPIPPQRL